MTIGIVQTIRVRRDRHNWPPGYFDELRGQRIPFPERGDEQPTYALVGRLVEVEETARWLKLTFDSVGREMGPE